MKRKTTLTALTLIALVAFASFNPPLQAEKAQGFTRADLDKTVAVLIGKAGFYQLTDDEGGVSFNQSGQLVPFGRKSYAVITGIAFETNSDGSLKTEERFNQRLGRFETRFFIKRDADGHLLVNLHVERDGAKGGAFDKVEVPFTKGRDPGEFDTIQGEDLVGL